MRILIVDDDRPLAHLLRRALSAERVEAELAYTVAEGLAAFRLRGAALILLDLAIELGPVLDHALSVAADPGSDAGAPPLRLGGIVFLTVLRKESPLTPVLVLSASADTPTRVECLNLGADDCLRKPFSLSEVRARVFTQLRRQQHLEAAISLSGARSVREAVQLDAGGLTLHRLSRAVHLGGFPLALTAREFALLEQLLLANGAVVSRAWLREVLGCPASEGNAIDVHVAALRKKLAASAAAPRIETIRGSGYRLAAAPGAAAMQLSTLSHEGTSQPDLPWKGQS